MAPNMASTFTIHFCYCIRRPRITFHILEMRKVRKFRGISRSSFSGHSGFSIQWTFGAPIFWIRIRSTTSCPEKWRYDMIFIYVSIYIYTIYIDILLFSAKPWPIFTAPWFGNLQVAIELDFSECLKCPRRHSTLLSNIWCGQSLRISLTWWQNSKHDKKLVQSKGYYRDFSGILFPNNYESGMLAMDHIVSISFP